MKTQEESLCEFFSVLCLLCICVFLVNSCESVDRLLFRSKKHDSRIHKKQHRNRLQSTHQLRDFAARSELSFKAKSKHAWRRTNENTHQWKSRLGWKSIDCRADQRWSSDC